MADLHTQEQRRFNMQQIKGKNTKPELLVRKYLHAQGYRYKLHDKTLHGKPDLVLPNTTPSSSYMVVSGMATATVNILL